MTASSDWERNWPGDRGDRFFGSIRRRVLTTLGTVVGWACFVLLFLAFWAHSFTLLQNIVVVVVSLILLFGTVFGLWISFGMRFMHGWPD
jgi:hypothetical protein